MWPPSYLGNHTGLPLHLGNHTGLAPTWESIMIEKIIDYSARNRVIILMIFGLIIAWGVWAVYKTPVDAIPDLSDNQVIVFTEYPGRSPQVVEDQVTYPLAVNLQGLPQVRAVRASSAFGFSMIYVIFEDKADIYWARTRVLERLNYAASLLPPNVRPTLGPDGTGVGHVYWYTIEGKGYDLEQLRTLQDWFVRYQLNTVPGVAEVASIGGFVREYQIDLDPMKLFSYKVTTGQVMEAVQRSNKDVGGRLMEQADAEYLIRGRGYIKSTKDLEDIVVGADMRGTPIYVKNLGTVQTGGAIRRGVLDMNGEGEAVGGIVVMRYGENAHDVIHRVKEKIQALEKGLPPGVKIMVSYDRSDLIMRAVDTLKRALAEESIVVSLVILAFLLHFQSSLVIVLTLPIAVLISFITMKLMGVTSNIMSLGGIAIAIGVLVDAGVIMVENCYRHLSELPPEERKEKRLEVIISSAKQVGRAIFFSLAIIILSFVPVFLLEGQEGKLFHPLAFTKTFSMVGSAFIAITLVPVLMYYFMRGKMPPESANPVSMFFIRLYSPVIRWVLKWKKTTIALNVVALGIAIPMFMSIGSEFMPPLDEGSLLYMPVTLPNVSISEAKRLIQVQDRIIKNHPEVEHVLGKVGRAETSTDPAPVSMFESIIILKPKEKWREGITKSDIVSELDTRLQQIGVRNGWTQPIINRINMLSTGVRTDLGVKIFGNDLNVLKDLAVQAEGILKTVPGAADVVAERVTGGNYIDIDIDREAAARYNVRVGDVQDVIETALGGEMLSTSVEGRNRFPIRIRYLRDYRDNIPAIQRILVSGMNSDTQVPLSLVTKLTVSTGAPEINSEGGLLRSIVFLNVRGRDMGGFVTEAKTVLEKQLKLPAGYYVAWSGQWENQIRAKKRLQLLVPAGIVIIFILLYFTFHSALEASMVMLSVPFALVGGVYLVWLLGYNMSVAVWVGFIALYGVAVETGVVMVIYLHEALDKKLINGPCSEQDIYDATFEGAVLRLRPKLMTVAVALIGLVPIMWSTGTGADVMKPIAAPMIGGMISSAIHVLIMTPVIFVLMKIRDLRKGKLHYSGMKH
ncbi:MAG: Cu(I)/Ag(I) efflux system membrane protein [Geobacteraceae bacterium]|nr:MAG: Cu(I)/Ag(I) efflux system membrane protein [Geobacteraceae bacterium]